MRSGGSTSASTRAGQTTDRRAGQSAWSNASVATPTAIVTTPAIWTRFVRSQNRKDAASAAIAANCEARTAAIAALSRDPNAYVAVPRTSASPTKTTTPTAGRTSGRLRIRTSGIVTRTTPATRAGRTVQASGRSVATRLVA